MLLCLLSPRLTLVTLGVVPMVGISGMVYGRRARGLSKLLKEEVAKVTVNLEQVLSNIRTVRHFAMDEQEAHRFGSALEHTATHVHTAAHAEGVFMGGLMFGGYGSLLGVLSYGSVLVSRGHLSITASANCGIHGPWTSDHAPASTLRASFNPTASWAFSHSFKSVWAPAGGVKAGCGFDGGGGSHILFVAVPGVRVMVERLRSQATSSRSASLLPSVSQRPAPR